MASGLKRLSVMFVGVFLSMELSPAFAQVFQVGAGSSSLYHAQGGAVEVRGEGYEGWVGVGNIDGNMRFGGLLRTQVRGYTLTLGDDTIPFRLPTDIFNYSHYFLARGAGIAKVRDRLSLMAFAGATSSGYGVPFFRGARAEKGVGLLFLESPLMPTLRVFSHNVLSDRQTSIQGVEWQPRSGLRAALAGGLGSNQGYFASAVSADRGWISLKAAYVRAGNEFRRVAVRTPVTAEIDRENVLITLRPKPYISLSVGRQNFLHPSDHRGQGIRGTVNQYLATLNPRLLTVAGAFFESEVRGIRSTGTSLSLGRDFAGRLQVNGNLLRSRPAQGPSSTTLIATVREVFSPRLNLLQLVSRSRGQTSVSFGGNFVSNRIALGVEYQTLYVPFRPGNQFTQALVLNIRLQPFGNFQANVGTVVAPDGTVRYTAYGNTFLYRNETGGGPPAVIALHRHVVRGRVVDEEGKPVKGAALRIDGDLAFSDSRGHFFVRKRRAGVYRLQVLVGEFLFPGAFVLISAPSAVRAETEDRATAIQVVVRRLTPRVPS